jgi:hypothetical protein
VPIELKSGRLNLLKSSGSFQFWQGLFTFYVWGATYLDRSVFLIVNGPLRRYTNNLYWNKCISFMIKFVSIKQSCNDTIKAVKIMYVQHRNSEEVGHFVSSKARPLSPSFLGRQLHVTQDLSLRLADQVSLRRRPELQTLADVKVFSCKLSIFRFHPNPGYFKIFSNKCQPIDARRSSRQVQSDRKTDWYSEYY